MSQHALSRPSDRLTHQQRIARAINAISGVGYQRCLQLVTDAANDGKLDGPLDPSGMLQVVNMLLGHADISAPAAAPMSTRPRRSGAAPSLDSAQTDEPTIDWSCELCGIGITGDGGSLRMPRAELSRYKVELEAFQEAQERKWAEQENGLRSYNPRDLPARAHWVVICRSCYHEHQRWQDGLDDYINRFDGYTIDVGRIDTHIKLLHWTSHLMTKDWLASTDWRLVLAAKTGGEHLRL